MITKILLVDDDDGLRRVLRRVLESTGFTVVEAGNGKEAFQRLAEQKVDLVVTDIIMPDVEGIETILRLRREHKGLPIIAMSGGARLKASDCLLIAKGVGASCTLTKPFTTAQMLGAIRQVQTNHAAPGQPA